MKATMQRNNVAVPTKKSTYSLVLVVSLFFLWGFAHNLNPILIPHLKKACQLTDVQSAFIDSAFFIAYFLMALPAGYFMKRYGYKGGILIGLLLFAIGAYLFFPAAETRMYGLFLLALFVIASGLTFLETAANPYINSLGDTETAAQRLNFAQSFNGLAATLAPLLGGIFILSGNSLSTEDAQAMSSTQLEQYLNAEAATIKIPYLIIGSVVLAVALLFWKSPLPKIREEESSNTVEAGSLWKEGNLLRGIVAQFFYIGAQVGIASFFIRFAFSAAQIPEKTAAMYLSAALLLFMIGRFVGTFLMKYFAPKRLLTFYSLANIVLLITAVLAQGMFSVYALVAVQFFMSIMFPTIFSLSLTGLGQKTKEASSLLIMSIVGGAIIPVVMGKMSDVYGIQIAYLLPAICFLFVLYFAWRTSYSKKAGFVLSH